MSELDIHNLITLRLVAAWTERLSVRGDGLSALRKGLDVICVKVAIEALPACLTLAARNPKHDLSLPFAKTSFHLLSQYSVN